MSDSESIKAIQQRMQQVRHDLGDEVGELVESAKGMTDWRMYLRANPWVCLAAAATIGYVVVPKRAARLKLNRSDLQALARETNLLGAKSSKGGGLRKAILSFVASAALRTATNYLKQRATASATRPREDVSSN